MGKNEKGCVAGMLGLSTQLKGYHCLAFKNCPGAGCTCEVRQGCSSSKAAAGTTKACLYGVKDVSECPADVPSSETSSAMSMSLHGVIWPQGAERAWKALHGSDSVATGAVTTPHAS